MPISLVTTKKKQIHIHPNPGGSSHRSTPANFRVHARWGEPVSSHSHHHRLNGDHGVIRRSGGGGSNSNGVFNNTPRFAQAHANNGYVNVHGISSPLSPSPTPVHDVDEDGEPGELRIVEEQNSHHHTPSTAPRSRSITPSAVTVPYAHILAQQNQLPPTSRGLKRILAEEEINDTSTSRLSASTSFAHSTIINTDTSSQMRIRHPKKANIFLHHQEELKQLNLNNNSCNSNSSSHSYANNNDNHNQESRFAVASSPSPTRSPLEFQVVEISTNSNNVTSVQPCDSSSSLVSSRSSVITSSTSPIPATSATKIEFVVTNNLVPPATPTTNINGALAVEKGKKVENKFTCTHCTKNFKKQSLLDAHMRLMQEKAKWKSFQKKKYIKTGNPPAPVPAQAPQPNINTSTSTSPRPNSTDSSPPNNTTANGVK